MATNEKRWSAESNGLDEAAARAGAAFGLDVAYLDEPCFLDLAEARAFMDGVADGLSEPCVLLAEAAMEHDAPTTRYRAAIERYRRYILGKAEFEQKNRITNRKSMFIGCKGCGSKLRVELLKSDSCPLCKGELRSKTTVDTLRRWDERIARSSDEARGEVAKFARKRVWVARRYA